ncbi:hypothetical protein BHM03_00051922 [Ensete ventricosum]|nr:hypothetical protein BHM03_00051922 [Ensete ventricosum]
MKLKSTKPVLMTWQNIIFKPKLISKQLGNAKILSSEWDAKKTFKAATSRDLTRSGSTIEGALRLDPRTPAAPHRITLDSHDKDKAPRGTSGRDPSQKGQAAAGSMRGGTAGSGLKMPPFPCGPIQNPSRVKIPQVLKTDPGPKGGEEIGPQGPPTADSTVKWKITFLYLWKGQLESKGEVAGFPFPFSRSRLHSSG